MKRFFALALVCLLLILNLCSCENDFISELFGESADSEQAGGTSDGVVDKVAPESAEFERVLSSFTSDIILGVYPGDYNHDRSYEAYALTSKNEIGEDVLFADGISVWFIKDEKAVLLLEGNYCIRPKIWDFSDKTLFCFDRSEGNRIYSNVFFTAGSAAYSYGEFAARLESKNTVSNDFYAFVTAKDSIYKAASGSYQGESVKVYYLYFDGNFFCEYGGTVMTEGELLALDGAKEMLDAIYAGGYSLGDIYRRGNGIININISKDGAGGSVILDNVTLAQKDGGVSLLTLGSSGLALLRENAQAVIDNKFSVREEFSFGGLYSAAAFPDIAVYPEGIK